MDKAGLLSIATANPPHMFSQDAAVSFAQRMFGDRFANFQALRTVFTNAGITRRYAVRPIEWYLEPRGWPERTEAFIEGGSALFIAAAGKAIAEAGLTPAAIDTIVTVSSTGIATPSLEARVMQAMGFRANVERVPIFGLGCAGGVTGLAIASRLAQARPGSVVLLVALELCTLAFRHDKLTKANIVATALFGDGAAACVLDTRRDGVAKVEFAGEHTWPDTLGVMGWDIDPSGFGVIFDRDIPPFAEKNLRAAMEAILARGGWTMSDVDRFVFHPGGTKVIQAVERSLHLDQGVLDHERGVLADYGNMSGPTALFVLKRAIEHGLPERVVVTAMGPGFTATSVALKRAA